MSRWQSQTPLSRASPGPGLSVEVVVMGAWMVGMEEWREGWREGGMDGGRARKEGGGGRAKVANP